MDVVTLRICILHISNSDEWTRSFLSHSEARFFDLRVLAEKMTYEVDLPRKMYKTFLFFTNLHRLYDNFYSNSSDNIHLNLLNQCRGGGEAWKFLILTYNTGRKVQLVVSKTAKVFAMWGFWRVVACIIPELWWTILSSDFTKLTSLAWYWNENDHVGGAHSKKKCSCSLIGDIGDLEFQIMFEFFSLY